MDYVGVQFLMIITYPSQTKLPHVTKMPTFRKLSDLGFYEHRKASNQKSCNEKKLLKFVACVGVKNTKIQYSNFLNWGPLGCHCL